jgi:hypothetical protein
MMSKAESRGLAYLLKLKQSPNVKKLISRAFGLEGWQDAGQGWEGVEEQLELSGWSKRRRVIELRRKLKEPVVIVEDVRKKAAQLSFLEIQDPVSTYEYAVLVTTLKDEVLTLAQHYRDRADSENVFDEMKNQWGWGGFTTSDIARCQLMARIAALVFNWWSLFAGLAFPDKHSEAITSRPLLLHAVARQTRHAGQKRLTVTSSHGKNQFVRKVLHSASAFLGRIRTTAEQLTDVERWQLILSRIFVRFLRGRILGGARLRKLYLSYAR